MKINFEWHDLINKNEKILQAQKNSVSSERDIRRASHNYQQTIVDISDKVKDDFSYFDQGSLAENLSGVMDSDDYVTLQRDFMTVMSNSMSASDFQKMKEEGYDISSMEPEQAVTILDKIKTVLAQAGTHIQGYNDNLSVEQITQITGNSGYAETIAKELAYADAPVTEENIKQIDEAVDQALTMEEPGDGSKAYMVSNKLEPTLGNLYKAQHSSSNLNRQNRRTGYASNAYSRQGMDAAGIRKTAVSDADYQQLEKEIRKRIEADGLEVNPDTLAYGKWLLEKELPVTGENIELLQNIENLEFPLDIKLMIKQAAQAISEGKSPFQANLNHKGFSVYEEAARVYERYSRISFQAVDYVVNNHQECNLRNMEAYDSRWGYSVPQLQARKTLEEVRLKMTVEANVKLLQSGYHIETAPMEELIKQLEAVTKDLNESVWGKEEAGQKAELFTKTQGYLKELPTLPISVVGRIPFMQKAALPDVVQEGRFLQEQHENAKESYETVMTAPRADLGDSIKKAFRNVDDILQDMELEVNEANRRAIRIMGYNQITITEENLEKIKKADKQVRTVIDGLKPGMTLEMIREGKNPLEMSMEELQDYVMEHENKFINETEKFSEFLYKLDKKKEITKAERDAYIGVYRLFRQIEKSDGAVIGSLLNQKADINLSNLLSAVRTGKAKHTDVKVDDGMGIAKDVKKKRHSISEQIEKGIEEVQKTLTSAKSSTTPEQIAENVQKLQKDQKLEKQFVEAQMEEIREAVKTSGKEKDYLEMYHQPATLDHLQSAMVLNHKRGYTFKKAAEFEEGLSGKEIGKQEESILKAAEEFLVSMDKEQARAASYEKMISHTKQILEQTAEMKDMNYIDVKELQSVYKQISVAASLSREENYEIPVQMGDEITSINLKIVHGTQERREVKITLETENLGKVEARFVETKDGLEGSVLTNYMDGKVLLESHMSDLQNALTEALKETKTEVKSLFFGTNEKLNLNTLETPDIEKKTDLSLLYKTAKEFIYYLKGIKEA